METTRRSFLKAASVVAGSGVAGGASADVSARGLDGNGSAQPGLCDPRPTASAAAPSLSSSFDPWVEVNGKNLRNNVGEISRRVEGRPVLAVIKNNGYGLGVVNAARELEPLVPISGFAVVKLQEAVTLRDAGVRKPVLLMGPFTERELDDVVARRITPMVYTAITRDLERLARKHQRQIPIHVCVDTGIGRVGVPHREAGPLIREMASAKGVRVDGTMMTFSEDAGFDKEQLARFQSLSGSLRAAGVPLGRLHAASSYGLFQRPDAFLDMVRPGMAVFGVYSEPGFRSMNTLDLRPALALKARVIYVKRLAKGESAGYNRAYVARNDVWVATLPVGHADGWPREAAKGASVRIRGRLHPVIASVSASHTIVELGSETDVQAGDVATFFDWQDGSRPEDVGASCDVSVYDLTMHLNPLLPRRTASA